MSDNPQLARYKKLLAYIDEHLHEDINIEKVEEICHYSYRNINRIFEATHQETIGKYVKRLRLEKAAQYLRYSEMGVSQIAYQVGFEDRSAFSKAFKKRYQHSPQEYRASTELLVSETQKQIPSYNGGSRKKLDYTIEVLPDFYYLFLQYRGNYQDHQAMDAQWEALFEYAEQHGLVNNQSLIMTEIIDDVEISDHINARYHLSLLLEKQLDFEPEGFFRVNQHRRQKYVKFVHQGTEQSSNDFYRQIFAFWMEDIDRELADRPILEFYPNYEEGLPDNELITEIYIAVS